MLQDHELSPASLPAEASNEDHADQKLLNELLASYTTELEALVRDAPLGFGYLSLPEMKFRYVNAALARINGIPPAELLGKTPKKLLGSVISDRHYSIVRRSIVEGTSIREMEAKAEVKGRPGRESHFLISYYPVRSPDGEARGLWLIVQDVTERRMLEAELPEQRARLKTLMDTVAAGILLSDADGNLVYANPEAERIWGHPFIKTGIEGYSQYRLLNEQGLPESPADTSMARILTGEHNRITSERAIERPDGSRVYTFCNASPIRDDSGRITGGLVVFTDITALKVLEQRQSRVTEIAQAVNAGRSLSEVLRMVRDAVVENAGFDRAGIWLYDEVAGGMRGAWGTDRDGCAIDETGEFFALNQATDHPLQQLLRGERSYFLTPEYKFAEFPSHGVDMTGVRAHATLSLRSQKRLIGMLFVDSLLTGRPIEETDLVSLIPFCEQAALAIDSAKVREAERDKADRLSNAVRETNHRVKNNLQVVAALLDMQLMESGETIEKGELQRLVGQIRAIASVHDFLSHSRNALDVNVKYLLEKLLPMMAVSNSIESTLTCDAHTLSVKQGTALALALNELVNNASKHGATRVHVEYLALQNECRLTVTDDGPGFPQGFDINVDGQLGLDLVRTLARWDLQGSIALRTPPGGCGASVRIDFSKSDSVVELDGWQKTGIERASARPGGT